MSPNQEEIANSIGEIIADYRNEDDISLTGADVLDWVRQFDDEDHLLLLSETKHILEQRYFSKSDTLHFLASVMREIPRELGFRSQEDFWRNALFLDLQQPGKSQSVMLELLGEVVEEEFALSRKAMGSDSHRVVVYLDDILCTGNTLFYGLKDWLEEDVDGAPRRAKLPSETLFVVVHMIVHALNLRKVKWRFRYLDERDPFEIDHFVTDLTIDNNHDSPVSSLEYVFPKREGLSDAALEYYSARFTPGNHGVFRPAGRPRREAFYSSPENRDRYEQILLEKGVELLAGVANPKPNMRPLGFSLPSYKDLGFGALAFTWRNVPNNTPLAFWYAPRGWKPLFPKR